MQKPGKKIVWYFTLAGFLVPCLLYSVLLIGDVIVGGSLAWTILIPWPTFLLVMSAEAGNGASGAFLAFLISALANALVYGAVGALVALGYRRWARALRRG